MSFGGKCGKSASLVTMCCLEDTGSLLQHPFSRNTKAKEEITGPTRSMMQCDANQCNAKFYNESHSSGTDCNEAP